MSAAGRVCFSGSILLPKGVTSANFRSSFVIDLGKARIRLRGVAAAPEKRPKLLETIELAAELRRRLDAGNVNRAALAREIGVSRARVTQLLALLTLHPRLLSWVRLNAGTLSEHKLRPLVRLPLEDQPVAATAVLGFKDAKLATN
jgi:hypothetical protein